MEVLGLDVGNGKVKLCHIRWGGSWGRSQIQWDSLPLPISNLRRQDFETGLPLQVLNFFETRGLSISALSQVLICCSHAFSYQPYTDSVAHLGDVLGRLFKQVPASLLRADGQSCPLNKLPALLADELPAYLLSNFYGSALLGSRLIRNGLSLDMGTTTLDLIPIRNGLIDPEGLADPAGYLRYRYAHGRIHWLGLTDTPLSLLADHVPV
ncbi:MAG: hypothetical protein CVV27_00550, partial [Candidatus Melainabacteria bacterium HGW-Melainabacteria-1]